uniref:Uncharacterized protein n=1 Tax=viral metagenome TaxID=1070528 RepID=A0A6M3LXU0_9ZZZZ
MVRLSKEYTDVYINPMRVVATVWRWKYLTIWKDKNWRIQDRASSTMETFHALQKYGVFLKHKGGRRKYYPVRLADITKLEIKGWMNRGIPVIATIGKAHEVCIVAQTKGHFEIIDSQATNGYRIIPDKNLSNYQVLI